MTTIDKTCNFNCTCVRPDCSFKHRIESLDERKQFKELYDKVYDRSAHNETDPEGCRHKTCFHGLLCNREDCGFKHYCNYQGRVLMTRQWYKAQKVQEKTSIAMKLDEMVAKYKFDEGDKELMEKFKKFLIYPKEEKMEK